MFIIAALVAITVQANNIHIPNWVMITIIVIAILQTIFKILVVGDELWRVVFKK